MTFGAQVWPASRCGQLNALPTLWALDLARWRGLVIALLWETVGLNLQFSSWLAVPECFIHPSGATMVLDGLLLFWRWLAFYTAVPIFLFLPITCLGLACLLV